MVASVPPLIAEPLGGPFVAGAFAGLEDIVSSRVGKRGIGFGAPLHSPLDQQDLLLGQRRWAVPFAGLLLALAVWLVLSGGEQAPFWWLAAVFFLVLLAVPTLRAWHLARRAELLADPPA